MQILRFPYTSFEAPPAPVVSLPTPVEQQPVVILEEEFIDLPTQLTLTQEEMAAREAIAKEEGYKEGLAKGIEQGRGEQAELEAKIAEVLQHVSISIASVQNMYQEAAGDFKRAVLELSGALSLKIAGRALQEKPDEAVMQMLESLLPNLIEQPSLVIEVHPDLADRLQEKIIRLSSAHGFVGQLKVAASAEVAAGDCKVEWEQGKAVLNQAALQQKIKDLLGI